MKLNENYEIGEGGSDRGGGGKRKERKGKEGKRKAWLTAAGFNASSIPGVGERHCRELSGIDTRGEKGRKKQRKKKPF